MRVSGPTGGARAVATIGGFFDYGRVPVTVFCCQVVVKVRLRPRRSAMHIAQYPLATKEFPAQARGGGLPGKLLGSSMLFVIFGIGA